MVRVHIFSVVRSGSAINEAMASPGVTNVSSVMFFRTRLERVNDLEITYRAIEKQTYRDSVAIKAMQSAERPIIRGETPNLHSGLDS